MTEQTSNIASKNPIVLFDGVCNLCNSSVQFLLRYNRKENLYFAALQSDFGKKLLQQHNLSSQNFTTLVLIENGRTYTKSKAIFQITKHLSYPWKVLYHFRFLPEFLSNWFYDRIAQNRYSWFGKRENCMIPKPEWQHRFYRE